MRLNSTNGWEGPAWSALSLVLNRGHTTYVSPVPEGRDLFQFELFVNSLFVSSWAILFSIHNVEIGNELFIGHVWVLVNSFFPGVLGVSIVVYDIFECGCENILSRNPIWRDSRAGKSRVFQLELGVNCINMVVLEGLFAMKDVMEVFVDVTEDGW